LFLSDLWLAGLGKGMGLVRLASQAGTGFSFHHKRSQFREKQRLVPTVNKKALLMKQEKFNSL
uniref:Uncharacterized protein n=1 Tax=Mus spicilegus TaxID=10103 RepID=A0A8C6HZZ4_MUSSI